MPAKRTKEQVLIHMLTNVNCWSWLGATLRGYGQIHVGTRREGTLTNVRAHRYVYELLEGPIPDGLILHHTCENSLCVSPYHLRPVTIGEHQNIHRDLRTHCSNGHEWTEENTYWYTHPDGYELRKCRQCGKDAKKRHMDRKA